MGACLLVLLSLNSYEVLPRRHQRLLRSLGSVFSGDRSAGWRPTVYESPLAWLRYECCAAVRKRTEGALHSHKFPHR
ncbi:hypothetical protein F5Y08DRAFT_292776 [Xylaria arbuscula]|nr:hypothetical protein F5Y08DRAFT_292776 [Xylaria arbuscula]